MARKKWRSQNLLRRFGTSRNGCFSRRHLTKGREWLFLRDLTARHDEEKTVSRTLATKMKGDKNLWALLWGWALEMGLSLDKNQWTKTEKNSKSVSAFSFSSCHVVSPLFSRRSTQLSYFLPPRDSFLVQYIVQASHSVISSNFGPYKYKVENRQKRVLKKREKKDVVKR